MKIEGIKTETGNQIIEALLQAGWQQTKAYSPLAFDKGIDYDSYTLQKGSCELTFEWSNWFEWEVTGPAKELEKLIEQFGLPPKT